MFILEPRSRAFHVNKERKKNKKTTKERKKRDEGAPSTLGRTAESPSLGPTPTLLILISTEKSASIASDPPG